MYLSGKSFASGVRWASGCSDDTHVHHGLCDWARMIEKRGLSRGARMEKGACGIWGAESNLEEASASM